MAEGSYHQFCPVAMASEILGSRWTLNVVRELVCGSTRFNDLRRGVPRMSPALLSKRLKELEQQGIVRRVPSAREPDVMEYHLTPAGEELAPIIEAIGVWGHRWTETKPQLEKLDVGLLMWDMRRSLKVAQMPPRRVVIQFIYHDLNESERNWWVLAEPKDGADLCAIDPGFNVDLYVRTDLRTMTAIWMGLDTIAKAREDDRLSLIGDQALSANIVDWLGFNKFAGVRKQVA